VIASGFLAGNLAAAKHTQQGMTAMDMVGCLGEAWKEIVGEYGAQKGYKEGTERSEQHQGFLEVPAKLLNNCA
jgi:hypothetical protein